MGEQRQQCFRHSCILVPYPEICLLAKHPEFPHTFEHCNINVSTVVMESFSLPPFNSVKVVKCCL